MRAFSLEILEGLRIAFRAIWLQKARALLTTLGIIIGIVSVTAMVTTINGIESGFDRSLAMLGENVLHVQRFPWFIGPSDWWKYRNRPRIPEDLIEDIKKHSRYAVAVAPIIQTGRSVRYRNIDLARVFIQASTAEYSRVSDVALTMGRFYNEFDNRTARNVCVIGAEVYEQVFPNENPLGKTIRVGGHRCEVIGVLDRQGKFLGLFSFDEQVQMPINTFKKLFGRHRSASIRVKVASAEMMDSAQDELTGILRMARNLDALEEDNFAINRQEAFRSAVGAVKITIYTIGLFLTALSLLVGGIGVMNIMFVSVKERTREIGIRKAVGARQRTILFQFLVESVIICLLGGAIGILISIGVTALINQFFTAQLTLNTMLLAFSICAGIGIVFGLIPAWSASRAHPIEALRYE